MRSAPRIETSPNRDQGTPEENAPQLRESLHVALLEILSPAEQRIALSFLRLGTFKNFTSGELLFRGTRGEAVLDFLESGEMKPKMGQHGSEAVFSSAAPVEAEEFMNTGTYNQIMVVFDKGEVRFRDENLIHTLGEHESRASKLLDEVLILSIAEIDHNQNLSIEQRDSMIFDAKIKIQNILDVRHKNVWELREPQPLAAVRAFIVRSDGESQVYVFNPGVRGHLLLLQEYIHAVRAHKNGVAVPEP